MKFLTLPTLGILLASPLASGQKPKTATPVKIDPSLLETRPYSQNGVIQTEEFRGSGFCAWSNRTFFTAAHVLFDGTTWAAPPLWYPAAHSMELDDKSAIPSRGYYRWKQYADLVAEETPGQKEFGRDVALGFAFKKLIKGKPATLNFNGSQDLRKNIRTLITGYPADNLYIDESIDGYFMHKTGPVITPYSTFSGNALTTTLVTTGHGNSGGPIWTKNRKKQWVAAGVLVGGLPSESVVYAFSKDTNSLLRAVAPVIKRDIGDPVGVGGVDSYSTFHSYRGDQKIPDGVHKWTSFPIQVRTFKTLPTLKSVKLSLDIRTRHRGDLQIILEAPAGFQALVHNEGGAGEDHLILKGEDFTEAFTDIDPNGKWHLRVQDRLKGDTAKLKSIVLEIAVEDEVVTPTP